MNPIVIVFDSDARYKCVHNEALDMRLVGTMNVRRASEVEFNQQTQQWEVKFTGHVEVSFTHQSRQACIDWEVGQLNRELLQDHGT